MSFPHRLPIDLLPRKKEKRGRGRERGGGEKRDAGVFFPLHVLSRLQRHSHPCPVPFPACHREEKKKGKERKKANENSVAIVANTTPLPSTPNVGEEKGGEEEKKEREKEGKRVRKEPSQVYGLT